MQYAIPQFTDVEDKLIGPLTLKQFLMVLGTGGILLLFWSIMGLGVFFFLFAAPISFVGLGLTFGKFNGRPMFVYLMPIVDFISKPKARVFKREVMHVSLAKKEDIKKEEAVKKIDAAESGSRLKKLAYVLDQKAAEKEELLGIEVKKNF